MHAKGLAESRDLRADPAHPEDEDGGARESLVHEPLVEDPATNLVRPRDDEKPRCPLVEAMDDPGPLGAVPVREGAVPVEERVHEGAGPVAHGRVDDHARLLVDDRERVILVNDLERDRLR